MVETRESDDRGIEGEREASQILSLCGNDPMVVWK